MGRLARVMGTTHPWLNVTVGIDNPRVYHENQITELVMHYGSAGATGGITPATCEVEVAGLLPVISSNRVIVEMPRATSLGMTSRVRFWGRARTQTVTETPRTGRPARATTRFVSSSNSAHNMLDTRRTVVPAAGDNLERTYRLYGAANTLFRGSWVDKVAASHDEPLTFGEFVDEYFAKPGYLVRQSREVIVEALTPHYRAELAHAMAPTAPQIMRSQVLGATEHEQSVPIASEGVKLAATVDGVAKVIPWSWEGSESGRPISEVTDWITLDMAHIDFPSSVGNHFNIANAFSLRTYRQKYTTPRITVDMIHLLSSGKPLDSELAVYLMNLLEGDPVFLGGDWPHPGVYYANGITETMNANAWTLELAITPAEHVTGRYGVPSDPPPTLPARVWAQTSRAWDTGVNDWSTAQ